MKKFIQNKLKDQKGLTLIELLAVIVILAIIAAIAIPAIGNIIENSRYSAVKSDATNVISAANIYFTENADKTSVSTYTLKNEKFIENAGKIPVATTAVVGDSATEYVKKNTNGELEITTGNITFSGSKQVKFTGATLKEITDDSTKGSAVGDAAQVIGGN